MAKAKVKIEEEVGSNEPIAGLEGENDIDVTDTTGETKLPEKTDAPEDDKAQDAPVEGATAGITAENPFKAQRPVAYFEEPELYNHSFDLEFILDVLQSEYSQKEKACLTRPSGATLLQNTYKPIFSAEGIGGIRRESVFSQKGEYYKIAASCSPEDDQRFINWDFPAVKGEGNQVMAQRVDPVQKTETVYVVSTR